MEIPPFITIILDEPPRGKGRPRGRIVTARGGNQFISFYTDAQTRAYEERLKWVATAAMRGREPLDEPLSVIVEAFMPIPASWSRSQRARAAEGEIFPVTKPDGDNIVKAVLDPCNGVVWRDDSIIVRMTIQKAYYVRPMLRITVWKWNQ